jgi:hypothetical protein
MSQLSRRSSRRALRLRRLRFTLQRQPLSPRQRLVRLLRRCACPRRLWPHHLPRLILRRRLFTRPRRLRLRSFMPRRRPLWPCRPRFVSHRPRFESSRRSASRKRAGGLGCRPVRSRLAPSFTLSGERERLRTIGARCATSERWQRAPDLPLAFICCRRCANTNPVVVRRLFSLMTIAGLIRARLGPGGGFELVQLANDITLRDVFTALESGELFTEHRSPAERILFGRRPHPPCSTGGDSACGRSSAGRAVARYDCRFRRRRACPKQGRAGRRTVSS